MKLKFVNEENYSVNIKLSPSVYGYVRITSLAAKIYANKAYKIQRTMEYASSFKPIRDRMLAGLFATQAYILDNSQEKYDNGELLNYYVVSVEDSNNIKTKVFSFKSYIIQNDSYTGLIKSKEFKNIPDIENNDKTIGIFNYGYCYKNQVDALNLANTVFNVKVFREMENTIAVFGGDKSLEFDLDNALTKQLLSDTFTNCDVYNYIIGLTKEERK